MFFLISSNNPDQKCVILGGKVYIVGRRDCDILLPGDQTVSRKHAELTVSHSEANLANINRLPILKLKDISKFGTWVNGERVEGERILKDGDSIYFGSPKSGFMIVYEPMVLTASCLDAAVKKMVKQYMCTLGGHMVPEWQRDCSLLVMSKISVTIKVISALVSQKFIVTPQYVEAYKKHLQGLEEKPDPSRFTPELAETQVDTNEVSFNPDSRRKTLFQGMTFYFLSPKQLKKMHVAIELAGGMPLLLDKGKIDKNILKPGSVVMNCTDLELTQSSDSWVTDVQEFLTKHDKHMIADAEIGFAVLYCSTEKHCNPDYVLDADISRLPSQSLSQVEPFVANTETQDRSQRGSKSQKRKDTQTVIDETKFGEDTGRTQTPRATQRDQSDRTQTQKTSQKEKNEKSQVVPVVKVKDEPPTPSRSTKKRNRSEVEPEQIEVLSKRVKAEPVTPSKSTKSNQSNVSKSKENKSSTSRAEDDAEIIWDSDDEIDYSRIDTDVPSKTTKQKTSPRQTRRNSPAPESKSKRSNTNKSRSRSKSPAPRSKSPAIKSKSPTPESTTKRGQRNKRSRSKSPAPRSRSPASSSRLQAQADKEVKKEPISPSPKTSSKRNGKGEDSENNMLSKDVKVEDESQGHTQSKQGHGNGKENMAKRQLKKEEEEDITLYDRRSGLSQRDVPDGFLTTRQPIRDQVQRHEGYERDEDLPVGCVHVETVSLISRKPAPKENGAGDCPEGFTRWKGKIVRNFKKFKKTDHAGSQGLPNIIGGSDLEVHVAKRSKELDDWFRESLQTETEHNAEEKRAQDLFDFDPSARRRGR
ncbi:nibrin-like isoform X2 [Ruditapes philippinarum]|uniref:nibrin-like isoform X2 n=1 Tax=Ruditapes philippinarum TaxID=129788 RepID=UPI00295AD502|nr:nibrin-like isoform X2 [Ruditapes philippinarum]